MKQRKFSFKHGKVSTTDKDGDNAHVDGDDEDGGDDDHGDDDDEVGGDDGESDDLAGDES